MCILSLVDTDGWLCQPPGALGPESVTALRHPQCWAGERPENRRMVFKNIV